MTAPTRGGPPWVATALAAWFAALPVVWAPSLSTFGLAKAALAWVGVALLLALPTGPAAPRRWPPAARLLAAAFALGVPSFLLRTDDVTAGLDRLALDGAVLGALAVLLARNTVGAARDRLLDAAVLGGTVAAVLDLAAGLAGSAVPLLADRPPFGNPMIAAGHAAIVAPLAVARAAIRAAAGDRRGAGLRYAAGALLLVSVGAAGSLGAVVAAAAGLGAGWVVAARGSRRWRAVSLAACAIAILVGVAGTPGVRHAVTEDVVARSYGWSVGLAAARRAPLLGHGAGDWRAAFYDAQGARIRARPADGPRWSAERRPHDAFIGRAVEDGFPAALLLAAALAAGVGAALRRGRPEAGALVAFLLVAIYAFPLRAAPSALLLPLLLAGDPTPAAAGAAVGWRAGRRAVFAVAALALVAWTGVRVTSDALRVAGAPEAALRWNPTDPDALFDAGAVALGEGRLDTARALLAASVDRRPSLSAALMAGNAALADGDLAAADRWYARALVWHPAWSLALHNRAWVATLRGDLDEARRLADEAARRNPKNPALRPLRDLLREGD